MPTPGSPGRQSIITSSGTGPTVSCRPRAVASIVAAIETSSMMPANDTLVRCRIAGLQTHLREGAIEEVAQVVAPPRGLAGTSTSSRLLPIATH